MALIGLINVNNHKVFSEKNIFIFDKSYSIKIDEKYDEYMNEFQDDILSFIDRLSIKNHKENNFGIIKKTVYNGKSDNLFINGVVGDNGVGKTTLLNLITNINGNISGRNIGDYNFLIRKDLGVIYIFSKLEYPLKYGKKLNIQVSSLFKKYDDFSLHNIVLKKRSTLEKIFTKILKKQDYLYAVKICSHSPNTKLGDRLKYLLTYIDFYKGEFSLYDTSILDELLLIDKYIGLSKDSQKEFYFLNIMFYFSWFLTGLKHGRTKELYEFKTEIKDIFSQISKMISSGFGINMIAQIYKDEFSQEEIITKIQIFKDILEKSLKLHLDNIFGYNGDFSDEIEKIREEEDIFYFKKYFHYLGEKYFDSNSEGLKKDYYYKYSEINELDIEKYKGVVEQSELLSFTLLFGDENEKYSFDELSSGEQSIIKLFHNLERSLDNDKEINLVLIDEPENSLHLRLQMKFLDLLMEYSNIFSEKQKIIQFIFTTHSPFLISDVPKDSLIFLEKKLGQHSKDISMDGFALGETFLTNTADIVTNGFFLNNYNGIITGEIGRKYLINIRDQMILLNPDTQANIKQKFDVIQDKFIKEMLFFLDLN